MNLKKYIGATVRNKKTGRTFIAQSLVIDQEDGEIFIIDSLGLKNRIRDCIRIVKSKKSQVLVDALNHISGYEEFYCSDCINPYVNIAGHHEEIARAALEKYRGKEVKK